MRPFRIFSLFFLACVAATAVRAQVIDSGLAGHYHGNAGSITSPFLTGVTGTIDIDVSTNGATSGAFASTTGTNGCRFSATLTDPNGRNTPTIANATVSTTFTSCSDARLNISYTVFVTVYVDSTTGAHLAQFLFNGTSSAGSVSIAVLSMVRTGAVGTDGTTGSDPRDGYAGMWYNPNESGWGVSVVLGATAARIPFVVIYIYSGTTPSWFVMPGGTWSSSGTSFTGTLYSTVGVDYRTAVFDPTQVKVNPVGSATIAFSSTTQAVLNYSVQQAGGGTLSFTKNVQKQAF